MRAIAVATVILVLLVVSTGPAAAGHSSKNCGVVAKGSRDYRVKARAMKCIHARKWARAFLRSRTRAPGFRCLNPPDPKIPFFCSRGVKAYWVVRL